MGLKNSNTQSINSDMKTNRYKILTTIVFFILFAGWTSVSAQNGEIKGYVTDINTGESLVSVNVGLASTKRGASTNLDGFYHIKNVPVGNYMIEVSSVGFKTVKKEIEVKENDVIELNFKLNATELRLQEVEIVGRTDESYKVDYSFTALKTASLLKDIPQSVSIISKEILKDQQTYNLGEVVKNISGVNQFSHYNDFTMRGFRGDARLINGLRAEQNFFSMPITPHLERVEVIKGPASALFADANPGGTINMVTKKPLEIQKGSISFTGGSFETYRGNGDITGPFDKNARFLYRLNAGIERSDSFRDFQGNDSFILAPSVSLLPTHSTKLNVDVVYHQNEAKLDRGQPIFNVDEGLGSTPISFTLSQPSDFYDVDNFQINTSLSQKIDDNFSFNVSYLRFNVNTDLEEHRTSNRFQDETTMIMAFIKREQKIRNNSVSSYLTGNFETGKIKHNALVGFDYSDSSSDRFQWFSGFFREEPNGIYPEDFSLTNPVYRDDHPVETYTREGQSEFGNPVKFNTKGFYFQNQLEYGRFKALFSLRQEFYEDVFPVGDGTVEREKQDAFLPRLGLVYELTNNINTYGTWATGFEPVAASNQNPAFGGPFDPERSELFEIGSKGTFFNSRLIATVSLYQIKKRNILVNANAPGNPDLLEQRGEQRSRGVELEMNGKINNQWSISFNYAHNKNEITESDDPEEIGLIAENAPRNQGGLWTKYVFGNKFIRNLGIAGGFNFVTERNTFDERLQLPGYVVFDAAVYYSFTGFDIAVNFNNVFDKTHWIGGYNFGRIFPGAPQNVRAKLTYSF